MGFDSAQQQYDEDYPDYLDDDEEDDGYDYEDYLFDQADRKYAERKEGW